MESEPCRPPRVCNATCLEGNVALPRRHKRHGKRSMSLHSIVWSDMSDTALVGSLFRRATFSTAHGASLDVEGDMDTQACRFTRDDEATLPRALVFPTTKVHGQPRMKGTTGRKRRLAPGPWRAGRRSRRCNQTGHRHGVVSSERAVQPHRRRPDPYRDPWPRKAEDRVVMTCDEMRRSAGTANAMLLVLAAWVIAWAFVGR